nr:Chain A, Predicted protein [Nematostella vectensis]6CO7_B Chain B, Predicted protein [Nematostella vectensis]6CO7_C Chain C, Predicted protein [Nematostella vectensis]6CO7_D Chain D, Predicted protein [Nematostella vectensis]
MGKDSFTPLYDGGDSSHVHLNKFGSNQLSQSKKSWIARNFSRRECIRFVPKSHDVSRCKCGRPRERHSQQALESGQGSEEWNVASCTTKHPTNAYGEIDFEGYGGQKRAPYLRMSHDTDANLVITLMLKRWNLEIPNLVISVTGGAKSFVLKPRLREMFRRGLIKAAKTTGAWIITGGTNTGVMKHVGEAVKEQQLMFGSDTQVNVIGIATWGIVDKQSDLISEKNGKYPALYSMEPTPGHQGAMLDPNHSHFFLVDDGTEGKYGVEIGMRSRIEEAIMKVKTDSRSEAGSIGVPVVLLVLEGGPNTVATMYELIKKKVPAVVIDGSGRAASVVGFAYNHTIKRNVDGQTINVIDPQYEDEVRAKVVEVFGAKGADKTYSMIKDVLEDEKMISVYSLDGEISQDIDLAILKALLKANRSSPVAQLNLALAWNRIDLAKSDIFTEEQQWTTETLSAAMLTALLDDKAEFAELFLQNGLSMREFLSLDILCKLYAEVPGNTTIKPLLQKEMGKRQVKTIDMDVVGEVIEELMGDMFESYYRKDGHYFGELASYAEGLVLKNRKSSKDLLANINRIDPLPTPYLDVFLWAVLCNRRELARVLWEAGREPMAAALMASRLLKRMASRAQEDNTITDISSDLYDHARLFEERAVGVLDECFNENETLSQTLLVRELDHYSRMTALELAVSAESQDFIAHTSCQVLLTRLWMGTMAMNTRWWKVLVCLYLPVLIFPIIYFVPDEQHERQAAEREHQKSLNQKSSKVKSHKEKNDAPVVPVYRSKEEKAVSNDEEARVGTENEEEDFQLEDYIPEIREDDSMEVIMRNKKLGFCDRIMHFYSAPFSKFVGNVVGYLAFIFLYAYVVLFNFPRFDPAKTLGGIHPTEIVLYFWVFTILIEEIRQLAAKPPKYIKDKVSVYFSDTWNFVDIFSLTVFIIAIILRFFTNSRIFTASRIILSLDIIFFIVRSLQIFSVNRLLGPKLVMIQKMMQDLAQFIIILAVFTIAYGIALHAVMFPSPGIYARNNTWVTITSVVQYPYWQMYGELFLDEIQGEKPKEFGEVDPDGRWLSPLLLAIYMVFTNILLLNLLIAIFNYTFERVQEDSDKVWKFQRYDLVQEYHSRPVFAPPLVLLGHILIFIRWVWRMCRCGHPPRGSTMKIGLSPAEMEQMDNWEFQAAEMYIHQQQQKNSGTLEERVRALGDRVDCINSQLNRVLDSMSGTRAHALTDGNGLEGGHDSEGRLARMEVELSSNSESLQKILALLQQQPPVKGQAAVPIQLTLLHYKARSSPYPGSTAKRFAVQDNMVDWQVPFPDYKPVNYTAPVVLANPVWADKDLMAMSPRPELPYNQMDHTCNVNRVSYNGTYVVKDGLPLNPMGRTGMQGRGLLGRFGPNHAADPVVTRWKRTSAGVMLQGGKKVLEFVAIQRKDNNQWAIPGGMVEPGQLVTQALKAEFGEEAMAKLNVSQEEKERIAKQIERLFQQGQEIYKGYVDDPRNTDNAWMETVAVNFHDDKGDLFGDITLQAGDDAAAVRWQRVSGNIPLYASHVSILEKVAKMRDAAFSNSLEVLFQ